MREVAFANNLAPLENIVAAARLRTTLTSQTLHTAWVECDRMAASDNAILGAIGRHLWHRDCHERGFITRGLRREYTQHAGYGCILLKPNPPDSATLQRVVEDRRHEELQRCLHELQGRVTCLAQRLDALERSDDEPEDECDAEADGGYDEINRLVHRVHRLETDIGYIRKMTDSAVDMTERTQVSFEKSANRNGERVNRLADWVRSEFQRRLRRATLLSVRPRFPKGYQNNLKTRSGSKARVKGTFPNTGERYDRATRVLTRAPRHGTRLLRRLCSLHF